MNAYYRSKQGDVKSYDEWRRWAVTFYEGLLENDYRHLPEDWFIRITKVLKLEEVIL